MSAIPDLKQQQLEELAIRCAAAFISIAEQSSPRAAYAKLATQRGRLDRSWYDLAQEIMDACAGKTSEQALYFCGPGEPPPKMSTSDLQNCATLAAAYWSATGGIAMHDALNRIILANRPLNPYWNEVLAQVAERLMDDMSTKIERAVGPARVVSSENTARPTWKHF